MNTIKNVLQVVIAGSLFVLAGCMSMEEMLASSDPQIHAWGEEMAVDYVIDRQHAHPLQEKQAILKEITDEMNLAEVYISERADPEIRKAAQGGLKSEEAFAFVFMRAKDPKVRQDAVQHITSDAKRVETAMHIAELHGMERKDDIEVLLKSVMDQRQIGKALGAHSEKAIAKFNTSQRYGSDYDDYKEAETVWKCMGSYITDAQAVEEIKKYELVCKDWSGKVYDLNRSIVKHQEEKKEAAANAKNDQAAERVKKLYAADKEALKSYFKAAFGRTDVSNEEKKFIESCARDGVMIGMPFYSVVEALGDTCEYAEEVQRVDGGDVRISPSSFRGRSREVYTKYPSGHTKLRIFGKDGLVIGLSSVPKDIIPTYKYKLATSSRERRVWFCGDMIAIMNYDAGDGVYNFHGVDKRLPSSFFAIEGMRLGMTKRETDFVTWFVLEFREHVSNPYIKLPKYSETQIGKKFPNITVSWGEFDKKMYLADHAWPVEVEYYFDVAYEITRHYSEMESKSVGGFDGLKQRLCQKLGIAPTKLPPKISISMLDKPLSKGGRFDKRFDPWAIWNIPEKDIEVELREIHSYDDDDKKHRTRCDLIIKSLSLLKAKAEGTKTAQTSASAGF